jgi:hypothetical protein
VQFEQLEEMVYFWYINVNETLVSSHEATGATMPDHFPWRSGRFSLLFARVALPQPK